MADQDSGAHRSPRPKYLQASSAAHVGRRKWSDWSECTENCIRTRHRLNCEDLTSPYQDSIHLLPALRRNVTKPAARRLQARSGQDDDLDYADEGDEDDEDDSCANVEPSRTFEEQVCSGGQCKSLPDESLRQMGSGTQMQHQSKGQHRLRPKGSANGYSPIVRAAGVQRSTPDSLAQNNQRTNVAANRTAAYIHKHSDNAETRRGIELVQPVDGVGASESPWPPRSMWPPSANASGATDQQRGHLAPSTVSLDHHRDLSLQLVLLAAAAIFSLVLVATLLIGRLFAKPIEPNSKPGTNWMRAAKRRQQRRRKSHGKLDVSSGSSPSSSCRLQLDHSTCQQALLTPQSMGHDGRLLCPSSYNHQPILIGQQLERLSQQHQHEQQQFCYFWERKRTPPKENPPNLSFASSLSHLAQQFGPGKAQRLDGFHRDNTKQAASYFVDRTDRHRQMAHQSQLGLCSTSSTCSSTNSSARRVTTKLISHHQQSQSHNHLGNSSIPICHFDPHYVEPNALVKAVTMNQDYEDYDTLDQCNQIATSPNKQPPKVPRATSHDNPTSGQFQAPTSSSSSSSLSVLSTTAQLVSNEANGGASSSLDQAPEIVDTLQDPADMIVSSSQSVAASAVLKRRQYCMSAGDRLRSCRRGTTNAQKTGDTSSTDRGEQQPQHFYEEISRVE